jgi:hypothetical protein
MPHVQTPWVGLVAVLTMFVIPFLPDWLFEGPRTMKHWPRRHVCGECGAAWTNGHACVSHRVQIELPIRGELRRLEQ